MKFALLHAYFHYRMGGTIYRNGGSVPTESRYHRAGQAVQLGPEYSPSACKNRLTDRGDIIRHGFKAVSKLGIALNSFRKGIILRCLVSSRFNIPTSSTEDVALLVLGRREISLSKILSRAI